MDVERYQNLLALVMDLEEQACQCALQPDERPGGFTCTAHRTAQLLRRELKALAPRKLEIVDGV